MESVQQALSIILVLGLLGGALWWLRRKGMAQFAFKTPGSGRSRAIQVLERMSLTPQHSLHLVRVGDRTVLIAASPAGCSILEGFAEPSREKVEIR
ncbi:MAG TPA: flagellar biosynthetic protein FliO [Bryobacteraceae bacterium]|nr:flagellar biosynthetic protein FliO [Bryobacteraceae bacterium]